MDYVNISGFTVKGAIGEECAGISLTYVEHCNISGNNASENGFGIFLVSSNNNTITNNYASNNEVTGIGLSENSRSNIITGNNASYNMGGAGIALANSGNNTLRNNLMSDNYHNLDAEGFSYSELDNDIDTSNLVDGKPIYYLTEEECKVAFEKYLKEKGKETPTPTPPGFKVGFAIAGLLAVAYLVLKRRN